MKYFLSFCGYPRSGHTLTAAILNSNPNVFCSNQLNLLSNFEEYGTKEKLFSYIKQYSKRPETWKSTTQIPHVPKKGIIIIGDKTGHRNTLNVHNNPQVLGKFKSFIDLPMKWIHVVRNPYDNLSTWSRLEYDIKQRKGINTTQAKELDIVIEEYIQLNETIVKLKRSENILTVHHEFVITRMHNTLEEIANFLEISFDPIWRDNVRNSVWNKPRVTRRQIKWESEQRITIQKIINKYPWLNGYAYSSCGRC